MIFSQHWNVIYCNYLLTSMSCYFICIWNGAKGWKMSKFLNKMIQHRQLFTHHFQKFCPGYFFSRLFEKSHEREDRRRFSRPGASFSAQRHSSIKTRPTERDTLAGWRSRVQTARLPNRSDGIMTSPDTRSRGVRACERDMISSGPPDKEPLSDRPLGWDTGHGRCITNCLTFIFFVRALVCLRSRDTSVIIVPVFVHLINCFLPSPFSRDPTRSECLSDPFCLSESTRRSHLKYSTWN